MRPGVTRDVDTWDDYEAVQMALVPGLARSRALEVQSRFGFEALSASGVAEVVRNALVHGRFLRALDRDGHATDRVNRFGEQALGAGPRVLPGNKLGEGLRRHARIGD